MALNCTAPKRGHGTVEAANNCPSCGVRGMHAKDTVIRARKAQSGEPRSLHATPLTRTLDSGNTETIYGWDENLRPHRDDDLPAIERHDPNGRLIEQIWYQHGQQHREGDKPSRITYKPNGESTSEWTRAGAPWREGGPSSVAYDANEKPFRMNFAMGETHPFGAVAAQRQGDGWEVLAWGLGDHTFTRDVTEARRAFALRSSTRFGVAKTNTRALDMLAEGIHEGGVDEHFRWRSDITRKDVELALLMHPNA